MSMERLPPKEYPKVELGRRSMAFGLDFGGAWLLSSIVGTGDLGIQIVQVLVFMFTWLILRVVVVYSNQGQSLGRWAFDMKVLDIDRGRVPQLQMLLQREAVTGFCALLVSVAIANIVSNPTALVLFAPLAIDCSTAFSDREMRQALHDRFAGTMVVSSRRGYSLDLKVKQLVARVRRDVRR